MSVYNAATAGITVAAAFLGTSFSLYAPPATPTITVDAATISAFGRLTGSVSAGATVPSIVLGSLAGISGSTAAAVTVANASLSSSQSTLQLSPITAAITVANATLTAGAGLIDGSVLAGATVANAILSSKGTLTGSVQVAITPSATLVAQGNLSGTIVPYTTLSPESLALFLQQNLKPRLDTIEQKVAITLALAAAG